MLGLARRSARRAHSRRREPDREALRDPIKRGFSLPWLTAHGCQSRRPDGTHDYVNWNGTGGCAFKGPCAKIAALNITSHTAGIGCWRSSVRLRKASAATAERASDALEFPNGAIVLLTTLYEGQHATVLQLPAQPRRRPRSNSQSSPRLEVGSACAWKR